MVDHGGREDELAAYVLLATSCDKSLATTAAFTSIRVVCQNTLFFAKQDIKSHRRPQVKVPHHRTFDAGWVKKQLGLLDPPWKEFVERVRQMAECEMKLPQAGEFFEAVLSSDKNKPLSPKATQEWLTLRALFFKAPGQELNTARETLWGAVNAVTYYVDHTRPGSSERLDGAWFGSGQLLKEKAWTKACELIELS